MTSRTITNCSLFPLVLAGLTAAPCTLAQVDPGAGISLALEEVVVTAQKRSERIQDVPVSVAVQTGAALEMAQVDSIVDLGARFANLAMPDTGSKGQNLFLRIRGFGNNFATRTLRAGVIVDEVPYLSPRGLNAGLFDIDRVQVLRGPQSTLYGLTAEAGLVIVESVKPNLEAYEGRLALQYGSEGEYVVSGRMSVPVVANRFAVALAATAGGGDGWIDDITTGRELNETQNWGARVRALAQLTDDISLQLQFAHETVRDEFGLGLVPVNRAAYNAANGVNLRKYQSVQDYPGFTDNEEDSAALTLRWDMGNAALVAVSAWRQFETRPSFDIDQGPLPLSLGPFTVLSGQAEADIEALSQEIRFESNDESALTWTAGAFYYKTENSTIATATIIAPIQTVLTIGPRADAEFESYAAFGQIGYTWDRLTLTGGARFEDVKLTDRNVTITRAAKYSDDIFLPKVSLSYALNDDVNVYGAVGRGWLAGGVFVRSTPAADAFYKPEESTTFELGIKGTWLDDRVSANLAVFRTEVDDFQELISTGLITSITANAGEVRFQGFEVEFAARLSDTLTLTADLGYADAEYRDYEEFDPATGGLINRAGNRVPGVAEHDFNVGLTYRNPTGWFLLGEVSGSGDLLEINDTRNIQPKIDGYTVVNLKAGFDAERWSVGVFCNNVGDARHFVYGNNQAGRGVVFGTLGRSRHVGVMAQYKFGAAK